MTGAKKTPKFFWSTTQELDFLRALGTFTRVGFARGQRALWQAYLDAMPLRTDWGPIDADAVRQRLRCWLQGGD